MHRPQFNLKDWGRCQIKSELIHFYADGPMRLPNNPSRDDRAGLRHQLLHLENTLMGARGSLDDVIIAIMDANDAVI